MFDGMIYQWEAKDFTCFYITILFQIALRCKAKHDTNFIPNKRELQQIASNHLSNTELRDFMKLYKDYTE